MAVTTESLTEKLIKRSDKNLEKKINEAFEKVKQLIAGTGNINLDIEEYRFLVVNDNGYATTSPGVLVDIIKKHILKQRKKAYQTREINEFLVKVESAQDEIENLYDEIHGARNNG